MPLDLPENSTVEDLVARVRGIFPQLAPPGVNIVAAVNAEYAEGNTVLRPGDEVALIPPVSGGQPMITVTREPLEPEKITALVRKDSNGAVVTFLGVTRDHAEGRKVLGLEYEAYEEMAVKELEKVRSEVLARYDIEDVAISHRIGKVDIGQISLVVATASPHRKEAFHACHEAVDLLKERVPIWKKEHFEDGDARWVACESHDHAPSPQLLQAE